ncbi:MAG: hypothetical protein WC707_05265 [Candidatus Babeliaceae bacterium]|jgi:hypothetical protein
MKKNIQLAKLILTILLIYSIANAVESLPTHFSNQINFSEWGKTTLAVIGCGALIYKTYSYFFVKKQDIFQRVEQLETMFKKFENETKIREAAETEKNNTRDNKIIKMESAIAQIEQTWSKKCNDILVELGKSQGVLSGVMQNQFQKTDEQFDQLSKKVIGVISLFKDEQQKNSPSHHENTTPAPRIVAQSPACRYFNVPKNLSIPNSQ